MKHDETNPKARREFLKAGAVMGAIVGTGAAAAALLPDTVAAAPEEPAADRPEPTGYKTSQHILDYYRTARI
jgi:hypothetical protein